MKYIVYCTRNNVNAKIYIGVHKTNNPYKFDGYLGNGCYTNGTGNKNNTPFSKAVKKYGSDKFVRSVLAVLESEEEAYCLESELVTNAFIKRTDTYNIIAGGKRTFENTAVTRYNLLGKYIKHYDTITEAAKDLEVSPISIVTACSKINRTCRGYYFRQNLNVDNIIVPDNPVTLKREGIPIVQYSMKGHKIKLWNSVKDAAKFYHFDRATITAACRGKKRSANKYQWRYQSDNIDILPPLNTRGGTPVVIFITDKSEKFIQSFKSMTEACELTNISNVTVCKALKDGRLHGGYFWHRQEVDDMI